MVELLTVVFIISLLIGILIPSINSARTAAKKATTSKALEAIRVGLEMFKNDNGPDFRLTNGYPPSFAHPKIPGYAFKPHLGEFPFLPDADGTNPRVYGAHWLPAMLMGVHQLGYVKRTSVPTQDDLRHKPWLWYSTDKTQSQLLPLEGPLYLDPGNIRIKKTVALPGRPNLDLFEDWEVGGENMKMKDLPVIVDSFDQPILYYVANTYGRVTNMVGDVRDENNNYTGGNQLEGVPFYFHQDNIGFTGDADSNQPGWDFAGRQKEHLIARSGEELTADKLIKPENRDTFAHYIVDRKIYQNIARDPLPTAPLKPVNADTYLLISPGPDGLYGTNDDVSNLPPWPDE